MDDDKLLQRFPSPDGKRWFELRQQSDGMFYFQEFSEATDAVPVYGAQSYTSPGFRSGLYKSAEAAEDDLRKMVPWLGGISKQDASRRFRPRMCRYSRLVFDHRQKRNFLVANNKHVTGRSEICYDSRDSGFARERAGVGGSTGSGGDCTRPLEHDPEKGLPRSDPEWKPVFRKDHPQTQR